MSDVEKEAEELLPCMAPCTVAAYPYSGVVCHSSDCPHASRPAVAAALRKRDDALRAIIKEPYGCVYCDSGKLRTTSKYHTPECGYDLIKGILNISETPKQLTDTDTIFQLRADLESALRQIKQLTIERDEAQQWIDSEPNWKATYHANYAALESQLAAAKAESEANEQILIEIHEALDGLPITGERHHKSIEYLSAVGQIKALRAEIAQLKEKIEVHESGCLGRSVAKSVKAQLKEAGK